MGQEEELQKYQTQVIMTILHIMGNLRHGGMPFLSEVELSYPQILVLYALLEKGTSTIGGLSRHLKISQGVMSRTVDRLADKGMIERRRDEGDRRVVRVGLSQQGNEFATRMITYHVDRFGDQFSRMPPGDRTSFLQILKDIDTSLEEEEPQEQ
jgi:MarR family transcriptional regulator, organic hydroperoxide resistance regulator